ncbi:MAG: DNA polymerase III subunit alpha, partial [Proteobacteria bacterium]|nr:DNA polymerase III subunit alpha [Pseudomonadota bacterium]
VGREPTNAGAEVRGERGPCRDRFDFAERVQPKRVGKRSLEILGKAGAFDSLDPNRAQVVAGAESLCAYAQANAEERASSQVSLFGGFSAHEAPRPRLPSAPPWGQAEKLDNELAAVGFYLTGHPLEAMADVLKKRRTTTYAEALALSKEGQEAFRMAGVIRRKQERTGGRNGERFAFVALSDPTGEYEVMFPPESLRRVRDVLEPGRAVVIKVRASGRDGELRFFGDDAEPIEAAIEAAAAAVSAIRIHLSGADADADALRRRLEPAEAKTGGQVRIVAALEGGREVELRLPGVYRLDAALRGALKTAPGVQTVEDVAA